MDEPLKYIHPFPLDRAFVLKLDRDADLAGGELSGRIVHMVSDQRVDFVDATGLLRALRALINASPLLASQADPCPVSGN